MGRLAHFVLVLAVTPWACAAAVISEPGGESGPAVGSFTLAPVRSYTGAYRNHSLNTWGGGAFARSGQCRVSVPHVRLRVRRGLWPTCLGNQQPDRAPGVDKHGGAICHARCSVATLASWGGRGAAHRWHLSIVHYGNDQRIVGCPLPRWHTVLAKPPELQPTSLQWLQRPWALIADLERPMDAH